MKMLSKYRSKWRSQLVRGLLTYFVLLLLQKERHGYEVLQLIRSQVDIAKDIADGPIYALLSRLKKEELLASKEVIVDGRLRRYFSLTDFGTQMIEEMDRDLENVVSTLGEFKTMIKSIE